MGYGRCFHGGGGMKGLMNLSISKAHFFGFGDGIEIKWGDLM
jgi:hypothetical protein